MAEKQQDHLLISVSSHNRDRTHIPLVNEHNDQAEEKKKKTITIIYSYIYIYITGIIESINFSKKREKTQIPYLSHVINQFISS